MDYFNMELEKTDLYKFIQFFCPTLYSKYVEIERKPDDQQNDYSISA